MTAIGAQHHRPLNAPATMLPVMAVLRLSRAGLGSLAMRTANQVIVAACVVGAAFTLLTGLLGVLSPLGYDSYNVLTGSMAPALPVGSIVVTTSVPAADIAPGDVITFQPPGRSYLVTHRVAGVVADVAGPAFVTKGDANAVQDSWRLPISGRFARVAFDIPLVGMMRSALATPTGRIDLIALGVLLFATSLLTGGSKRKTRVTEA